MLIKDYGDNVVSIKRSDSRYKYDSAMAEYLSYKDVQMFSDRESGDVECPTGYFAQFGRRILVSNDRGFVWVEVWPSEESAEQVFYAMEHYYSVWSDEEDCANEMTYEQRTAALDVADKFLAYVAGNASNNLEAFSFDRWVAEGKPKAYAH